MSDNIQLNIPDSAGAVVATEDVAGVQHQKVKVEFGADGVATMVDTGTPLPVTDAAAETSLASILAKISADPATQTTLAAVLAKIIAAPATEAKQDTGNTSLSTIAGKDFATQTTLAALLAKVIAAPATEAKQDTGNTSLSSIDTKTPALGQALAAASTPVVLTAAQITTLTPPAAITGYNLEATQLLVKAKTDNLDVALSTRLKAADTLAAVTLISDIRQATAGNLNMTEASAAAIKTAVETIDNFISGSRGLVTEDNSAAIKTAVEVIDNFILGSRGLVTEDNSAAILSVEGATADVIVAAGATGSISAKLRRATQGLEDLKTLIVLAAGSNIIGKVGIDQTTPGTTNAVSTIAGQSGVAAGAGLVSATTQRVTQASDGVTPSFPQVEGKWQQEILTQMLLEMRINNQLLAELPLILSGKNKTFDEPNKFRNEQSIFIE